MPEIATPVSHLFLDNSNAKKIFRNSDCLELREKNLNLNFPNEFLFHVDKDITLPWNNKFKNFLLKTVKLKKKLKLITFQSTRCCEGEQILDGKFQISGKVFKKKNLLLFAKKNIRWLKKKLKKNIKIGLENNNYYPEPAYDIITDGSFISEIIRKNKIFFLLDIAHAKITAYNKKINFKKYLNSLPLDKTIQLHIVDSSIKFNSKKKIAVDTHKLPTKKTFKIVDNLVKKYSSIEYLTIEYYKNSEKLINSIRQLRKIINTNKPK